jgi:hypothetical protein
MLTATIIHPHYFTFGSEAASRPPEKMGLADLSSPRRLSQSCDAAYRLFYCCLPLYDRVRMPESMQLLLLRSLTVKPDDLPPQLAALKLFDSAPGRRMLKHLVDTGVAEFDPAIDATELMARDVGQESEWKAIRREFMSPDVVEAILFLLPSFELSDPPPDKFLRRLCRQTPEAIKGMAGRVAAELRGEESHRLSDLEEEILPSVEEMLDGLADLCEYAARMGHDVYDYKHFMPLLLAAAVRDKVTYTGLRSFSLALPVIDSTESCSRAHASFDGVRKAVEPYQRAVAGTDEDIKKSAYMQLDDARHEALKREFDSEGRRDIVTVTCLMTTVHGAPLRFFLPDDHFHLSLSMLHWKKLSGEQVAAFELLLDTVLLGIKEMGPDGSNLRTLLAQCACQPLLDFVVFSQYKRLELPELSTLSLGNRWGGKEGKKGTIGIVGEIRRLGGTVGGPLEYLGERVLKRRNKLAHPSEYAGEMARTRGETLSDLCRLVDFIRLLDCSIPPTV